MESVKVLSSGCYSCPIYLSRKALGQVVVCRTPTVLKEPVVLFIGQHPGRSEVESNLPFVGITSESFIEKLRELSLWDHSVFTNVIKCAPNGEMEKEELRQAALCCVGNIIRDIEKYKPSYICLLGEIAALAFFRQIRMKRPHVGEMVTWRNISVFWTHHPAAAYRNPNIWSGILEHLNYLKVHINNGNKSINSYEFVDTEEKAKEAISYFANESDIISCDLEVDCDYPIHSKLRGKSKRSKIIMVGLSDGNRTVVFNGDSFMPLMRNLLLGRKPHKVFHNALFELMWFWRVYGQVPPPNAFSDNLIMYYLLNEDRDDSEYSLKSLSSRLLGASSWVTQEIADARQNGLSRLPLDVLCRYNASDAFWTIELYKYLKPKIIEQDLEFLLYTLVNPLQCLYALAAERGIRVDEEYLRTQAKYQFEKVMTSLAQEIYTLSKGYIRNPRSWQEKQYYLFKVLKIESPDGNETSNRKFLEALMETYPEHRPLLSALIEFSRLDKIYSSYISKWDIFVDVDGRIRPEFKFFGTRTGRLSVEDPPFHNFPSDRTSAGAEARRFIVPSEGYCFLYADASQFEVRVMANKSGDENLQNAFFKGHDVYTEIASIIFGKNPSEIDKNTERQIAKQVVLGIFYGMSVVGLSQLLRIPPDDAEKYIQKLKKEFPKVFAYMDNVRAIAARQGFVRNWHGRYRRVFAALRGDERALRQAANFEIQSEASDWWQMTTLWFYRIAYKRLGKDKVYVLATIHDSLLAEVQLGYESEAANCLRDAMVLVSALWDLNVPIDGEYCFLYTNLGDNKEKIKLGVTSLWRECKEEIVRSLFAEFGIQGCFSRRGM